MENEFVSYTQALALKELGFDEESFGHYRTFGKNLFYATPIARNLPARYRVINAPLYQQAFSFFREKHKLHSTITSISQESWQWHITKPGESLGKLYDEDFYTYEEAEQSCLNKLIEICKAKTNEQAD